MYAAVGVDRDHGRDVVAHHARGVVAEADRLRPRYAVVGALDVHNVGAVRVEVAVVGPGDIEAAVVGVNRRAEDGEEAELVARADRAVGLVGRGDSTLGLTT